MRYQNAPIQEAVLDIKVTGVKNPDVTSYIEFGRSNLKDYPIQETRVRHGGSFKFTTTVSEVKSSSSINSIIFSPDKGSNKKIQFRKDGYSFNMLKPYSNWEEFSMLALKYWEQYKEIAQPSHIERIGVRYINRIELPLDDEFDFDHYFNNAPKIPSILEQKYKRFFLQMEIPCNDAGIYAIITQTFHQPHEQDKLNFIFDIDVFNNIDKPNTYLVQKDFNELRDFKNKIFEDIITNKTRGLFN